MLIDGVGLFTLANKRLDYLSVRHTMIAQNVSHADTPDYKPQDLKPFAAALRGGASTSLAATHAEHLAATRPSGDFAAERRVEGWEVEPSGNGVLLEEQMIKAADINKEYQLAATLIKKHLTMLRASLNTRS